MVLSRQSYNVRKHPPFIQKEHRNVSFFNFYVLRNVVVRSTHKTFYNYRIVIYATRCVCVSVFFALDVLSHSLCSMIRYKKGLNGLKATYLKIKANIVIVEGMFAYFSFI